jgi:hypothetical protein
MRKVVKTNVKKSDVKILQNTEALFEKICYLRPLHKGSRLKLEVGNHQIMRFESRFNLHFFLISC